ncbi:hypothetical protein B296_00023442, partial [Ensete ventricosum]
AEFKSNPETGVSSIESNPSDPIPTSSSSHISPSPAMESKSTGRFTLGRQSSLAPRDDRDDSLRSEVLDGSHVPAEIGSDIRLMYLASEGDLHGIQEILDSGVDVNFSDIDGRTALHVAACQGFADVVELLIRRGAKVDPQDQWSSTVRPRYAMHYSNHEVIRILEQHGAKLPVCHACQLRHGLMTYFPILNYRDDNCFFCVLCRLPPRMLRLLEKYQNMRLNPKNSISPTVFSLLRCLFIFISKYNSS